MIRVLIVHDFSLICNLLTAALKDAPDIEVVGCARSLQEARQSAAYGQVDVALVGLRLPEQGALKATQAMSQADPGIKVLVFGLSEEHEQILPFIEAGAAGYIQKDESVAELIEAIRAAYAGKALVSPEIAAALIQRLTEWAHLLPEGGSEALDLGKLTPREREVLDLLQLNLSNQEIAARLSIEPGTVKLHIHNLLHKLGVSSRQRATTLMAIYRQPPNLHP